LIDLAPISNFLKSSQLQLSECDDLGFISSTNPNTLSYISEIEYLDVAENNANVVSVLWDTSLGLPPSSSRINFHEVSNSKLAFLCLQNSLLRLYSPNQIAKSASISKTAVIAEEGVQIEEGVVIEDFVIVNQGTQIGSNSVIRSGSVLGSQALFLSNDLDGSLLEMNHLGGVYIGEKVTIGNNCVIDRAIFSSENTIIGDNNKVGSLTNISHGVKIGVSNRISAGVNICGYTQIGNDSWIGPNVTISHMLQIGSRVFFSLGSTVLQDIQDGWKVVGPKIFKDRKLF
jgi:UDP-3-O-[3-hydroxymyristoyl] glucosamine N-acyltransferase